MNIIDYAAMALNVLANISNQLIEFLSYKLDFSIIGLGQVSVLVVVSSLLVVLLIYKFVRWMLF